jgi:hypothetical protein
MHRFPVPVIAVFTKYDQFLRNVEMHLEDYGNPDDKLSDAVDSQFKEHYLAHLGDGARFVLLESLFAQHQIWRLCADSLVTGMHKTEARCHALLEETVKALDADVVGLMFLAVQRGNLELCINASVKA